MEGGRESNSLVGLGETDGRGKGESHSLVGLGGNGWKGEGRVIV